MKPLTELLSNLMDEKRILEASCMSDCTLEIWVQHRKFITEAIHHSGSILDIGCANGLLLHSLMEWSSFDLIPYGIDNNSEALTGIAELLPGCEHHFANLSILDLEQLSTKGLPSQYDFIYWNVWDNLDFSQSWHQGYVESVFKICQANTRLILGFYAVEPKVNKNKISWFNEHYPNIAGRKDNLPHEQVMIWYDF
jgi:hypothetical protein